MHSSRKGEPLDENPVRTHVAKVDLRRKLTVLADAAKYDASCASSGSRRTPSAKTGVGSTEGMGICHSYTPDGRCVSLLKILLTNYCVYDCSYCVNRLSSNTERARFTPEEVVKLTIDFYRRNYIEGLFLSSGVLKNADYTMEQVVEVARSLREDHAFGGYIHLKAVPGASPDLIQAAGRYADRLSCNVELPTESDLAKLAPEKRLHEIESVMEVIQSTREEAETGRKIVNERAPVYIPAGQSTQMIVGATPTPDASILHTANRLYDRYDLRRVYYSAFSPIPHPDAQLPNRSPPLVREHRLYQADWLLRFYGFRVEEVTPPDAPNLDLQIDPKLAWALKHRSSFPLDVSTAPRELLLRVPGLGRRTVSKILRMRRHTAITWDHLKRMRVPLKRTRPFLIVRDGTSATKLLDREDLRRLLAPADDRQLDLFAALTSARTGEL